MKQRIISVTNQKGGVAKTTTVIALGAGLALRGRRVLVVDTDPQANATFSLLGPGEAKGSLYDVLITKTATLSDLVTPSRTPGVDVVPSNIQLSAADIMLAGVPGRERLLARRLKAISGYDYILLDTPPSLGLLTVNSLTTATEILIPVGVGTFALLGIRLLEDTIDQLKENLDLDSLEITGVLATLYDRTRVAQDTIEALRAHFGPAVFQTVIPKNKDIEEAHSRSESIFAYAPESKAGQAYSALVEEVIAHES